jgi:hypothetical protein
MKIKAAAIRRGNKIVATGISHQDAKLSAGGVAGEYGFLTDTGLFVDRMRAAEIALSSGQAKEISDPDSVAQISNMIIQSVIRLVTTTAAT